VEAVNIVPSPVADTRLIMVAPDLDGEIRLVPGPPIDNFAGDPILIPDGLAGDPILIPDGLVGDPEVVPGPIKDLGEVTKLVPGDDPKVDSRFVLGTPVADLETESNDDLAGDPRVDLAGDPRDDIEGEPRDDPEGEPELVPKRADPRILSLAFFLSPKSSNWNYNDLKKYITIKNQDADLSENKKKYISLKRFI